MAACTRAPASKRDKIFIVSCCQSSRQCTCCYCYTAGYAGQLSTSDPEIQHAGTKQTSSTKALESHNRCRESKLFVHLWGQRQFACMPMVKKNDSLLAPMPLSDQTDPSQSSVADQGQAQRYQRVHPARGKSLTRLNDSVLQ